MVKTGGSRSERAKEKAIRAKSIAVEKYKEGDLAGAKEFAFTARCINPTLCGLIRLNAILNVLIAFGKKFNNGEVDWYAVLAVHPTAKLKTIEKAFKRVYLDIIYDDDISIGSIDEANKILADAWTCLCDEKRKKLYDERREAQLRLQNFDSVLSVSHDSSSSDGSTFWTTCLSCRLQFEYPKSCKDQMLMCVHCCKPFEAIEYPAPSITRNNPWSYDK